MRALASAALLLVGASMYGISAASRPAAQPAVAYAGVLDEHPAIEYATRSTEDRVARLMKSLAEGTARLTHEPPAGFLRSLLAALEISPESQLLVFSKTGLQRGSTGPRTPRALYFNDDTVVGYIPGARFLEVAAHDPQQGVVFYTVDQSVRSATPVDPSAAAGHATATPAPASGGVISRPRNCVTCHVSGSTLDVPGMITRSNFTNAEGGTLPPLGFHIVDHRTPLSQRWGGWFVTGNYVAPPYGGVGHMGNVATTVHPVRGDVAGMSNEVHLQWLDTAIDTLGYPSHESDIAALMVFDHQMRAINLLTRLNWETRVAAHDGALDFTRPDLSALVAEVVDYFLFVDEAPPPARLTPRPGFAAHFVAAGRRDAQGRSLRELDLERRLLRYSCSYMIQSAAFHHLPEAARSAVYRRLTDVLTSRQSAARYAHLSRADRRAILEILSDTGPGFAASIAR